MAAKLNKSKLTSLKQPGKIDRAVANSGTISNEDRKFTVGHEHYREDLCEIKEIPVSPLRKVLENYKKLTKVSYPPDLFKQAIEIKPVIKSNHYAKFYASLPSEDIELKEFDAGQYRAMFYIDPYMKTLQMIAIVGHPEDRKIKRG